MIANGKGHHEMQLSPNSNTEQRELA